MTNHTCKANPTSSKTCNTQSLIKELRKMSKVTQQELATRLGTSQQEISKLEKSDANINLTILSNICTQLDIFPLILFSSGQPLAVLDSKLVSCFYTLKEFPEEKQNLICELINLLS